MDNKNKKQSERPLVLAMQLEKYRDSFKGGGNVLILVMCMYLSQFC